MVKVLMVCLGNICRSPLAEGLLASKLPQDRFTVDSAGTGDWHVGHQPDKRSVAIAKTKGLDISCQRGRQFAREDFTQFDYIFAMDMENLRNIRALAQNELEQKKAQLVLDVLFPGENVEVPDPYFGLENGFEIVYKLLDEATQKIADELIQKHP